MAYDPTKVNLGADMPTAPTASDRDPWQEALTRFRTVPASKVLEAADVIRNLNGSWAAHYVMEPGYLNSEGTMSEDGREPANRVVKSSRLGQPGVPEINFDLYAHRTNRFAHKGGSLLGHPISFSTIGPTLKRDGVKFTNWQWQVIDNSAIPGTGDELILDTIILDPPGPLPIPRTFGLTQRYGLASMADVPDGLYVVIIQTGETGNIVDPADPTGAPVPGSTGDGFVFQDVAPPLRVPLQSQSTASKYEIFRVVDLAIREPGPEIDTLILDPSKRISDYFNFTPAERNTIRAVMLMEPKATRLVAVPDSGDKGTEQVHIVVPPERAAHTDQHYPYNSDPAQPSQPDGWIGDDFIEPRFEGLGANGNIDPYSAFEYRTGPTLPIPRSTTETEIVRLIGEWTPVGPEPIGDVGPGRMPLAIIPGQPISGVIPGQVIHIHEVKTRGTPTLNGTGGPTNRRARYDSMLGWFEVVRILSDESFLVRRVPEVDPTNGNAYFGNSLLFQLDPGAAQYERVELHMTVHDPISQLWNTNYFDIDQVESARLTNLINPDWAERLIKDQPITQARADRAVFDTTSSGNGVAGTNANPGSLLDLGFRMVLYPATVRNITVPFPDNTIGWNPADPNWGRTQVIQSVVPDFDRPVMAHEAILDVTSNAKAEKQFVEVDYSNGIVRLSHAPTAGSDLYPTTNAVFTADDNPRGELVIFACCIPYSMEEGQLGSAIRATASPPTVDDCEENELRESLDQQDVFGQRVYAPVRTQTITSEPGGATPAILVYGQLADQIPATGFVDILQVEDLDPPFDQEDHYPMGTPAFTDENSRGATFGYYGVIEDPTGAIFGAGSNTTGLMFPFGGGVHGATLAVDMVESPAIAVLRRDVTTPNSVNAIVGTPYQDDTSYGDSWRAKALRFENAFVKANADGTTTVTMDSKTAREVEETLGDLFSTWILDGCELSYVIGATVDISHTEGHIIQDGRRRNIPWGQISLPAADGLFYLFLDASNCWRIEDQTTLPLPSPQDVLLGMAQLSGFPGTPTVTLTDLRYPLDDVDRRWDVTVGKLGDAEPKWASYTPHFDKLADAVKYVNNLMLPLSGTADRHYRIRIVGPTDEDAADLPITFATDGVIVEGAARLVDDAVTGDPVEVQWDSDNHLIDFNGYSGIVFRNVSFKFTGAAGSLTTPSRSVFTQDNEFGLSYNNKIEGCVVHGPVQGLVSVVGTRRLFHLSVERNYMTEALDYGVYVGGGNQSFGWILRDNTFSQNSVPGAMANTGAVVLEGIANNYIENNLIGGFEKGVYIRNANGDVISRNFIRDTLEEGIYIEDGDATQIICNRLDDIYTTTPSVGVSRTALWVQNGEKHKVDANIVTFDSPSAGDLAVHVEGTGLGNIVSDNDVANDGQGIIRVATEEAQIKGNKCKVLTIGAGSCRIETNRVSTLCELAANNQRLSNNHINSLEAGFDVSADAFVSSGHIIQGNSLTALYLGSSCEVGGNTVSSCYVRSNCNLNDNSIFALLDYKTGPTAPHPGENGDRISMIGNRFISTIGDGGDGIFECERSIIDGNLFQSGRVEFVGNDNTFNDNQIHGGDCRVDGTNNNITGNNITGGDLEVYDTAGSTGQSSATGNVIQGAFTIIVAGSSPDTTVTGNRANAGTLNAPRCILGDNRFDTISAAADDCAIKGNVLGGTLSVNADDCTVSGNRVGTGGAGGITINGNANIITGNWVQDNISQAALNQGNVIVGNRMEQATQAGGDIDTILVGNRINNANGEFGVIPTGPNIENNSN